MLRGSNVESERNNEIFYVHCTLFKSRNRPWNLGDVETETFATVSQKDVETDKDRRLSRIYWPALGRIADDFARISYSNSSASSLSPIPRLIIKDPEGSLTTTVAESKQVTLARVARIGHTTDTVLWGQTSLNAAVKGRRGEGEETEGEEEEELGSGIFALVGQKYIQHLPPKQEPTMNQTLHFWMTSTLAQFLRAYKPTDPVLRYDTPREMLKGAILTVLRTRFRVNQNAAHIDKSVKQVRANITASKNRLRLLRQAKRDKDQGQKSRDTTTGLAESEDKMDLRNDTDTDTASIDDNKSVGGGDDDDDVADEGKSKSSGKQRVKTHKTRQGRKAGKKGFFHEILIKNYFRVLGQDEKTSSTHRSTAKGRDPTSSELIHLLLRWGVFHVALEGLAALMDVELLDLQDPEQIDDLKNKEEEAHREYQDAMTSVRDAETERNAAEANKNSIKKIIGEEQDMERKNNRFRQDIGSGSGSGVLTDVWELRFRPSEPLDKRQNLARVILSTGNKDARINDLAVAALDSMPAGSVPADLTALSLAWKTRASSGSGSAVLRTKNTQTKAENEDNDIVMNTIPPLESDSAAAFGSSASSPEEEEEEEEEETKEAKIQIKREETENKQDVAMVVEKPKGRRGAPIKSEAEKAETVQRRLELAKLLSTLKTKEAKAEAKAKFKELRAQEKAKKQAKAKADKAEAKARQKAESKKTSASASGTVASGKIKKEPGATKRKRVSTKKSSSDEGDKDQGNAKSGQATASEETPKPAKKRGRKVGQFNTPTARARDEYKNILVSKNEDLYKAYLVAYELGMEWYRASARVPGTVIHRALSQWRQSLSNQLNQDRSSSFNHLQTRTFKLFNTLSAGITFPVPGEVARSQEWYSPWYHMYHLENTTTSSGFDCLWSLMPSDEDLRKMVPEQVTTRLCTPWSLNQYMTDGKAVIKKIQEGHGLYTTDVENARYYKDMVEMGIRAMYKPIGGSLSSLPSASTAATTTTITTLKKKSSTTTDEIKTFASSLTIAAIDASPSALAFVERSIFLRARAISAPDLANKRGTGIKTKQQGVVVVGAGGGSATVREMPLYFPVSYFWLLNSHSNRGAPKQDLKGSRSPPFDVPHNGATRETESKFLVPANARMDYKDRASLVANLVFHGIISDKQGQEDLPFLGFPRVVNPWIGQQEIPLHALRRLVRMMVIVRLMHPNGQVASTPLEWLSALGNMMGTYDPRPFLYTEFKEIGKNGENVSGIVQQPLRAHTRASDRSNPFPGGYAFYFYDALLAVHRHVQLVFEQLYQDRDQNPNRSDTSPKFFEPPLKTPKPSLPTLKSITDKANDVLLDSVASDTNNGALSALKQAYALFIRSKDECEAWYRDAEIAFRQRQIARFDDMIKADARPTKVAAAQKAKERQQIQLDNAIKKSAAEKKKFIQKHGFPPKSTKRAQDIKTSSSSSKLGQQREEAVAAASLLSLYGAEGAQEFDVDDFVTEGVEQDQQDKNKSRREEAEEQEKENEEEETKQGKKSAASSSKGKNKSSNNNNNNKGNRAHAFAYMAQGGSSAEARETRASDFFKYEVLRELCTVAKQQNRIPATPLNALVSRVYSAGRLFVYIGMFYDRLLTNEAWGQMIDKAFIPGINAGNQASRDEKFLAEPVPDYGNIIKKQPRHHTQIREILAKSKSKKGQRSQEAKQAKKTKREKREQKEQQELKAQEKRDSEKQKTEAKPRKGASASSIEREEEEAEKAEKTQETEKVQETETGPRDEEMKYDIFTEPPRLVSVSETVPRERAISSAPVISEHKFIASRTLVSSSPVGTTVSNASPAFQLPGVATVVAPTQSLVPKAVSIPRPAPPVPKTKAKFIPATKQRRSLIDDSLERMAD